MPAFARTFSGALRLGLRRARVAASNTNAESRKGQDRELSKDAPCTHKGRLCEASLVAPAERRGGKPGDFTRRLSREQPGCQAGSRDFLRKTCRRSRRLCINAGLRRFPVCKRGHTTLTYKFFRYPHGRGFTARGMVAQEVATSCREAGAGPPAAVFVTNAQAASR